MVALIKAKDSDILYRKWDAANPQAVLLLVHGLGAHSARWNFWGEYFAARGFSSYAIELKGFGQTPDRPRGHIDSFDIYYQDTMKLRDAAQKEHPGKKIFLIGESLGGLISFMTAALWPDAFAGLVLMSPAFGNAMKFSPLDYLQLPFFLLVDQKHQVKMPFTAAMCTRDLAYQKVMDSNPDEYRSASVKLLVNTLLAQIKSASLAKRFRLPVLLQVAGHDVMISAPTAKKIFAKIGSSDKTLLEYPDMVHALYIDLDREKVYADILAWLDKRR
ncbi:MAG TPA: alpha/beta fold hydrolase [Candidatus Sulfotelmatobacter sp.]|nr:alpha/beta fold hydrolase [Candidatus Sulfotelmatobacter sp.]